MGIHGLSKVFNYYIPHNDAFYNNERNLRKVSVKSEEFLSFGKVLADTAGVWENLQKKLHRKADPEGYYE